MLLADQSRRRTPVWNRSAARISLVAVVMAAGLAMGGDEELRRDVESLLAHHDEYVEETAAGPNVGSAAAVDLARTLLGGSRRYAATSRMLRNGPDPPSTPRTR